MTDAYDHSDDGDDLDTGVDEGLDTGTEEAAPERAPLEPAELERRAADKDRALKAERAARRSERRHFEQQLAELRQQRQEPAPKAPDPINPEDDPIGALVQTRQQLEAFEARQRAAQEAAQRQGQEQQFYAQVESRVNEYEAEFTKTNPDYPKAAEYLTASRTAEYQQAGYTAQQIAQALRGEYIGIIQNAESRGMDPAEVFYNLAKGRGFRPGQTKLDSIANGQRATGALNGGGRGGDGLTMGAVADLDGEDFDKAFDKLRAQALRRERGR